MISFLLPDLRGGGTERVSLDLARQFVRQGHRVEFVLMEAKGEFLAEAQAEFIVHNLNTPRARYLPLTLARYLRQHRPNALVAAMWPLTVIAPLMRLIGYRGQILVVEHNTMSVQYADWGVPHHVWMRATMALGYRMAHARAGVSGGVTDDLAALSGLPRSKFAILHNPIPARPVPDASALRAAEAFWADGPGGRIVTVGSLKAQKNHALLLKAFARVTHPGACLTILGTGAGEAELRWLAAELRIDDRVNLAGFQSDPTPFYMTADVFALSSDYEGFGNVIVEAMACGTPIVSTDCPSGPAEILQGGRFGRLVPVGDAPALARAMEAALSAPVEREALIHRAADFAPEIAARKYLDLLGLP